MFMTGVPTFLVTKDYHINSASTRLLTSKQLCINVKTTLCAYWEIQLFILTSFIIGSYKSLKDFSMSSVVVFLLFLLSYYDLVSFQYKGCSEKDPEIKWFWSLVFTLKEEEKSLLLKFVTGSPCLPIGGFAHLIGLSGGVQRFRIDRNSKVDMVIYLYFFILIAKANIFYIFQIKNV